MKFSTETLMAYADGELDAATRTAIETEMATDPQVAAEVASHRALQARLSAAFAGVIHETVPDALIATARTAPASRSAQVADIAAARDARQVKATRKWSWPEWGAIAASLIAGVLGGHAMLDGGSADSIVASNGRMIAAGALASALDTQLGGATEPSQLQIGASFRSKSGEYCRTFTLKEEAALAGMACRDANQWQVRALAQSEAAATTGDYKMASTSLPPVIAQAVAESMDGEALDSEQEAAARERGWR